MAYIILWINPAQIFLKDFIIIHIILWSAYFCHWFDFTENKMSHKAKLLYECKGTKYPLIETSLILPTRSHCLPYKKLNFWDLTRENLSLGGKECWQHPPTPTPMGTMLIYAAETSSGIQTGTTSSLRLHLSRFKTLFTGMFWAQPMCIRIYSKKVVPTMSKQKEKQSLSTSVGDKESQSSQVCLGPSPPTWSIHICPGEFWVRKAPPFTAFKIPPWAPGFLILAPESFLISSSLTSWVDSSWALAKQDLGFIP